MKDTLRGVLSVVIRHLPDESASSLRPDDDLREAGLDSMGIVSLLAELETEFGVEFRAESITPSTFRSVRALRDVIAASRPQYDGISARA